MVYFIIVSQNNNNTKQEIEKLRNSNFKYITRNKKINRKWKYQIFYYNT